MSFNWNIFKTQGPYFTRPSPGQVGWLLNVPDNGHDAMIDRLAAIERTVLPADETISAPELLTPSPSPWVHIASTDSEKLYISGNSITAIELWSERDSIWVSITLSARAGPQLAAGQQCRISYADPDDPPRVVVDFGFLNNAAGVVEAMTPEASPWTVPSAAGRSSVVHISGGAVTAIKRAGFVVSESSGCDVPLAKGGAVVIEYNGTDAPYVVRQS